jgi:SAM-dependent methyltransferase
MTRELDHDAAERLNRAHWDEIAPVHMKAYKEVALLRQGEEVLDDIELQEVGPVEGKSLLHLQCHIGSDTLAWARHGATVTGVDFSLESITCARSLAAELELPATFVHSNIYDLRDVHDGAYDVVYTGKGALCWLRDLPEWGRLIAHYLKPGGIFYLMESHPILNALDPNEAGDLVFTYPYFHKPAPMEWAPGDPDYADSKYIPTHGAAEWEWSVSDIIHAVMDAGLHLELVHEHETLFFQRFPGMTPENGLRFRLPAYEGKLPLLLTLRARKPANSSS